MHAWAPLSVVLVGERCSRGASRPSAVESQLLSRLVRTGWRKVENSLFENSTNTQTCGGSARCKILSNAETKHFFFFWSVKKFAWSRPAERSEEQRERRLRKKKRFLFFFIYIAKWVWQMIFVFPSLCILSSHSGRRETSTLIGSWFDAEMHERV